MGLRNAYDTPSYYRHGSFVYPATLQQPWFGMEQRPALIHKARYSTYYAT